MKKLLMTILIVLVFTATLFAQVAVYRPYSPNFEGNIANFYIDGTNIVDYITSGAIQISSQYLPLDGGTISNNLIIMGSLIVSNADNNTIHMAIGKDAIVNYDGLFAAGDYVWASSNNAIALGYYVYGTNSHTFTWQGITDNHIYGSHGNGTFNINPEGGTEGIFIGNTNLNDILTNAFVAKTGDEMTGTLKTPKLENANMYSHAYGNNSFVSGEYVESYGNDSVAIGNGTYSYGIGSIASGYGNVDVGIGSIIISGEANATTYTANIGNAVRKFVRPGVCVYVSDPTNCTKIISVGENTITVEKTFSAENPLDHENLIVLVGAALGSYSFSSGLGTVASGDYSFAGNRRTIASGNNSFAIGSFAIASNDNSFVWNRAMPGDANWTNYNYGSHGNNTFNINPAGEVNGTYIGTNTLGNYIDARIQAAFTNAAGNNGVLSDPTPANRINDPTSW